MKYLVHYSDEAGDIDYTQTMEYNGSLESLLKNLCEKNEEQYQRIMKALSERAPDEIKYTEKRAYHYEIYGNEARIYTIWENILVLIITAMPVEPSVRKRVHLPRPAVAE